jgi:hypothetical protein
MKRHLLVATLLMTILGPAASSADAAHCRPRPGEHQLARSAQAVVVERTTAISQNYPVQTITGCSRRSGRRRVIDVLQRRSDDDPTKLVGLRLAGTRVAYVRGVAPPVGYQRTTIIADDAVHGGRRHDLGGSWPFDGRGYGDSMPYIASWAVNAHGDIAWIAGAPVDPVHGAPPPSLVLWHAGLGRRLIDAKADLHNVKLAGSALSWGHNGARRSLDIAAIRHTHCAGSWATGTLDVDLDDRHVCRRATGRTMSVYLGPGGDPIVPIDINGLYILTGWSFRGHVASVLIDLVSATTTEFDTVSSNTVLDAHGSMAWVSDGDTLWVRDANGTRTVPGKGTGGLLREGSTVTWPGGPTVTLSP